MGQKRTRLFDTYDTPNHLDEWKLRDCLFFFFFLKGSSDVPWIFFLKGFYSIECDKYTLKKRFFDFIFSPCFYIN